MNFPDFNKRWVLVCAAAIFSTQAVFSEEAGRPEKPNIILLLTDDLGWQDVKCYDIDEESPMETPNIDMLAGKGVMFWQGYSPAPVCSPSRCAILSGNHPARAQKTSVVGGAPPHPHNTKGSRLMDPWYSGRMPADELTIARVMKRNGYATGHSGKWHIAIDHNAFPQPGDVGFDFTRSSRGSRAGMAERLKDFATTEKSDPFRLDENGFPYDETNEDALTFLKQSADKPFFLYYATWLVHTPIHTRSEERLAKYALKIGVDPAKVGTKRDVGQINPFYAAMVEELDYYVGQIFSYLETTEDPRWPGHMLSENTYIIFTSDNGGMEGGPTERYTDNNPLDRGKISAKEGGTRVPLIITGPGIPRNVQTDVMANGLDFYPTILSLAGIERPEGKNLDGCDLAPLLLNDPSDPTLVREADGSVRNTMIWHFPHGAAMESTIRSGDFKVIRNYDNVNNPNNPPVELFQLYETKGGKQTRVDLEEAKNLVNRMPEIARGMQSELISRLVSMEASFPYYNPNFKDALPHKNKVPSVQSHDVSGNLVRVDYKTNGAEVVHADLIYTLNGGEQYEEWFRGPAEIGSDTAVSAELPAGTTHFYINLIDENNFLVSYPEVKSGKVGKNPSYTGGAIEVAR